jgi:phosphoribosylaminoimidazolecarboxamide formyltransferase/IMP cyclohydrolase
MEVLGGKALGYNNLRDIDLAWKAVCAFGLPAAGNGCGLAPLDEENVRRLVAGAGKAATTMDSAAVAVAVAVKHNSPCGVAAGGGAAEAFERTYDCDPVSIFGGVVAFNARVDETAARRMAEIFLEAVVAPDYTEGALSVLREKKNLRVIKMAGAPSDKTELVSIDGGVLVQERNCRLLDKWEVVTQKAPPEALVADMLFGLRTALFVKSNAIVVVKDCAAVGIGGGQTARIDAAVQAIARAQGKGARVLASDAFFPFPDVVEAAAAAGMRAIVQSGGSLNDRLSIEACDRHGIAMVFTGIRGFKH